MVSHTLETVSFVLTVFFAGWSLMQISNEVGDLRVAIVVVW